MTDEPGLRLAYADRWLKQYGGTIAEDCESSPLVLIDDESTDLLLRVTGDEFRKLLACVMLGEGLLFPEFQYEIQWSLLRSVECGMLLCDRVADCIENSDAVAEALTNWLIANGWSNGGAGGSETQVTEITGPVIGTAPGTCDDDALFGMCYDLVEAIHVLSVDMLEVVQLITDQAELAIRLAQFIPIVGQFATAAIDFADTMLNFIIDNYEASYSQAVREEIASLMYCQLHGGDCTVTLAEIQHTYETILEGYTVPGVGADIGEVFAWFATLALTDETEIVAALHLAILELWSRGGAVFGASPNVLTIAADASVPVSPPGSLVCCDDNDMSFDYYNASPSNLDDWDALLSSDIDPADPNALNDASGDYQKVLYNDGAGHYFVQGGGYTTNHLGIGLKMDYPSATCALNEVSMTIVSSSSTCRVGVLVWTYTTGGGWVYRAAFQNVGATCADYGVDNLNVVVDVGMIVAEKFAVMVYSDVDAYVGSIGVSFKTP